MDDGAQYEIFMKAVVDGDLIHNVLEDGPSFARRFP
jgi:hypothetical protein